MSEQPGRDRHRRNTFILTLATLAVAVGGVAAVAASAGLLNGFGFLRFPLGFYLLAQGLLFALAAAMFWAAAMQEHIDRRYGEGEEP